MKYEYKIKRMISADGYNINSKKNYDKESFQKAINTYLDTYRPTCSAYISRNIYDLWKKPMSIQMVLDFHDIVGSIQDIDDNYCYVKLPHKINDIDDYRIGFFILAKTDKELITVDKVYRVVLYTINDTFEPLIEDTINKITSNNEDIPLELIHCKAYVDNRTHKDDVLKHGKSNDIFEALNYIFDKYNIC